MKEELMTEREMNRHIIDGGDLVSFSRTLHQGRQLGSQGIEPIRSVRNRILRDGLMKAPKADLN